MKSEKLSKYSDLFLFFAIIDVISFGNSFPFMIRKISFLYTAFIYASFNKNFFTSLIQIILYLSIIATVILHFKKRESALIIYYIQFVIRFIYFSMSFGILLRLSHLVDHKVIHNMLIITVMGLEIYRLALTITLHRNLKQ